MIKSQPIRRFMFALIDWPTKGNPVFYAGRKYMDDQLYCFMIRAGWFLFRWNNVNHPVLKGRL